MSIRPAEARREFYRQRRMELEEQFKSTGLLRRQDWWSLDYFKDPYLIHATSQKLHKRYQDLAGNSYELDASGKISPVLGKAHETWTSLALHVQEELFARKIRPLRADEDIHLPIPSFPEAPPGLRILDNTQLPKTPYLVKCGKEEHIRAMVENGEIQISPASSYSEKSHTIAIQDQSELELLAYRATSSISGDFFGIDPRDSIRAGRREIEVRRNLPNFYMFCTSHRYDFRLLSDFGSNAIAFIERPDVFLSRLVEGVAKTRPELVPRLGAVQYYDPYFVSDWSYSADGFLKHFRYAYQNEFRICWNSPLDSPFEAKPFFINIGSMTEYAKFIFLPTV